MSNLISSFQIRTCSNSLRLILPLQKETWYVWAKLSATFQIKILSLPPLSLLQVITVVCIYFLIQGCPGLGVLNSVVIMLAYWYHVSWGKVEFRVDYPYSFKINLNHVSDCLSFFFGLIRNFTINRRTCLQVCICNSTVWTICWLHF